MLTICVMFNRVEECMPARMKDVPKVLCVQLWCKNAEKVSIINDILLPLLDAYFCWSIPINHLPIVRVTSDDITSVFSLLQCRSWASHFVIQSFSTSVYIQNSKRTFVPPTTQFTSSYLHPASSISLIDICILSSAI